MRGVFELAVSFVSSASAGRERLGFYMSILRLEDLIFLKTPRKMPELESLVCSPIFVGL